MTSLKFFALLALLGLGSGCYTTTLRSGEPAGAPASGADERWHSGILTGGVDLDGAYDLKKLCPSGWAEIRTETSVFNEVVELATMRLYAPQTVSVRCRAAPGKTGTASSGIAASKW